jgi:hypothetical protein
VTRPFSVLSTLIIFLSHPILFKIYYLFVALLLTIGVLEFDPFGLSVKDLSIRNVITR